MASRKFQALDVSLLHACNSGDTAGKPDRVVGYAAFALR
jgi:AmmeMemoRadiSam system protein B